MAITTTRATAARIDTIITRVRRTIGDTETTAANQRWSDSEIIEAVNFELLKMATEAQINDPEPALESTTLSYSGLSTALPSAVDGSSIFMVEDYSETNSPVRLDYVSVLDLDTDYIDSSFYGGRKRWSIQGANIVVRPKSDLTLRIWYVAPPYIIQTSTPTGEASDSSDQHSQFVAHEELISLGAALRLQENDDEIPRNRFERYIDHWRRFQADLRKNSAPIYVRRNRRWR